MQGAAHGSSVADAEGSMTAAEAQRRALRDVLADIAGRYAETTSVTRRHALVLLAAKLADADGPRLVIEEMPHDC